MTIQEAFKLLKIERYSERIFHSDPTGNLFHLPEYILLALWIQKNELEDDNLFSGWIDRMVEVSEDTLDNPELVFLIIPNIFKETLEHYKNK